MLHIQTAVLVLSGYHSIFLDFSVQDDVNGVDKDRSTYEELVHEQKVANKLTEKEHNTLAVEMVDVIFKQTM